MLTGCCWGCLPSSRLLTPDVKAALALTDRVLLDIKYTDSDLYKTHVGCDMDRVLSFLSYLQERQIPTTVRQVIIPTLNDTEENVRALKAIADAHSNVDKIELLPFRKICQVKYDKMNLPFRFRHIPEPTRETMAGLEKIL